MPAAWSRFIVAPSSRSMPDEIETAFGRDFLAVSPGRGRLRRAEAEREVDNPGVLPISRLSLVMMLARKRSISRVLHVAPVRAQMRGDPACAGPLAKARDEDRIGLGVLRFRHRCIARLPQSRDVIDVDAELQFPHGFQ